MRRFLLLIGVGVLLITAKTEAKEKNRKQFPSWGTEDTVPSSVGDDFTLEGADKDGGSGDGNTHEDDEDFDVTSGDGEVDKTYIDMSEKDDDNDDKMDPEDEWSVDKKKASVHMTDDEDLYDGSGSGDWHSMSDIVDITVTPVKTEASTRAPSTAAPQQMSACQNLRKSAVSVAQFVPDCDEDGAFTKTQCMDISKEKYCWCVNVVGTELSGTRMKSPKKPDCDFGSNLGGCVFQLVQNGQNQLGAYRPRCTKDGMYEPIQCEGSKCWCVDKLGNQLIGSFSDMPNMPDCDQFLHKNKTVVVEVTTEKTVTMAPVVIMPQPDDTYNVIDNTVEPTDDIDVKIGQGDKDREEEEEDTNSLGTEEDAPAPMRQEDTFIAQPGLLAAIIGGAVVGLLCMVLLVMFVVYRMRKKDEGSYPLEEQKYQNYSYAKAPDKEFYA